MPSIDPVLAGQDIRVEISIDSDSTVRATLYFLGRAVTTGRAAGMDSFVSIEEAVVCGIRALSKGIIATPNVKVREILSVNTPDPADRN